MRDVHDARVGTDVENHRFAKSDRIVGGAEIGHEDDRRTLRVCLRRAVLSAAQFVARNSEERKHGERKHKEADTALHEQIPPAKDENPLTKRKMSIRERQKKRMRLQRKS